MCSIKVTQQKYGHSHSPNNGQVIDWSLEVLLKCQVLFVMDTVKREVISQEQPPSAWPDQSQLDFWPFTLKLCVARASTAPS